MTTAAVVPVTSAASSDALQELIATMALPTKRDEAWRYAPHSLLERLSFGHPCNLEPSATSEIDAQIPQLDGPRVVLVNGVIDNARSSITALPAGVHLSTPDEEARHDRDVTTIDAGPAAAFADVFAALNVAFSDEGVDVHIGPGHQVDGPIHIVTVSSPTVSSETASSETPSQNASCSRLTIRIDAGSSATVVETRLGVSDEFSGSNVGVTISLAEDAKLDHIVIQDVPSSQVHLSRAEASQGARSELRARLFNLGGAYGRLAYDVHLEGEGASVDLGGLYLGAGNQVLDQQITVVHAAENCASRQTFRGVLDDESTGVFNGAIEVRPGANGTDAEQSNDSLLLSNRAEANTQPRLEILADDVACKHGATVGQLDDEAMYYLRTRGIAADEARRLLINGFADQAVHEVPVESLRKWLAHRLGHDHE